MDKAKVAMLIVTSADANLPAAGALDRGGQVVGAPGSYAGGPTRRGAAGCDRGGDRPGAAVAGARDEVSQRW